MEIGPYVLAMLVGIWLGVRIEKAKSLPDE